MENIKDLFKLELKDNVLVCPGLAKRIKEVLVEGSELLTKIRSLHIHSKNSYNYYFPITSLLKEEEIQQLKELGVKILNQDHVVMVGTFREESAYIKITLHLCGYESVPTSSNFIEEVYSFVHFSDESVRDFKLIDPVVVMVHHGGLGVSDDRNWGLVPIISKWRLSTKEAIEFKNHPEICMCVDPHTNSLLNIIDVLRVRQEKAKDSSFIKVAKDIDSISFDYIKDKYGISDMLKTSFYDFGRHGYDLLSFGESHNIPELLDLENSCLLSILIGIYLFRGRNSYRFPIEKLGRYSKKVTILYRLYHVYMTSLSAVLGLPESKIIKKLSDENLQGIGLIPSNKFSEFLVDVKKGLQRICRDDKKQEVEIKMSQKVGINSGVVEDVREKLKEISSLIQTPELKEKILEFNRLVEDRDYIVVRMLMNNDFLDNTERVILRAIYWYKMENTFIPKR